MSVTDEQASMAELDYLDKALDMIHMPIAHRITDGDPLNDTELSNLLADAEAALDKATEQARRVMQNIESRLVDGKV